jgi:hypothetical protein
MNAQAGLNDPRRPPAAAAQKKSLPRELIRALTRL